MHVARTMRPRLAALLGLLIGLAPTAAARADVWVSGAGGVARELEHRLDVAEVDGLARLTMRRVVRNDGDRAADLVLAFRVPAGAVATGLAASPEGRATLRWGGADLLVLVLPRVGPRAERRVDVTLWAPLEARQRRFDLRLPGPDEVSGLAPRRVFVAGDRTVPSQADGGRVVSLARRSTRGARARHAYLPLAQGGLLLAELDAPRFYSPRVNPARAVVVLDVDPASLDRALVLAGAYVGRFAQGMYHVLLPTSPPRALTDDFVDATWMLGALEAQFARAAEASTPRQDAARPSTARLLDAARERLGEGPRAVRIVLVTDRQAIGARAVAEVDAALVGLQDGSAVHVVLVGKAPVENPGARDARHPLAAPIRRHNGVLLRFDPDASDLDAASLVMGHLVRPMWVDDLDLVWGPPGTAPEVDGPATRPADDAPSTRVAARLREGRARAFVQRVDAPPAEVAWRGRLWTGWWSATSEPQVANDERVAVRAVASPGFEGLSPRDHDRVAQVARAITRRWQWTATPARARHERR